MAQVLGQGHIWAPTPRTENEGTSRPRMLGAPGAPGPLSPLTPASMETVAVSAVKPAMSTRLVATMLSLGLAAGAVGGGLIAVVIVLVTVAGAPVAVAMVLGGAGIGALGGLLTVGGVAVNTAFGSPN